MTENRRRHFCFPGSRFRIGPTEPTESRTKALNVWKSEKGHLRKLATGNIPILPLWLYCWRTEALLGNRPLLLEKKKTSRHQTIKQILPERLPQPRRWKTNKETRLKIQQKITHTVQFSTSLYGSSHEEHHKGEKVKNSNHTFNCTVMNHSWIPNESWSKSNSPIGCTTVPDSFPKLFDLQDPDP